MFFSLQVVFFMFKNKSSNWNQKIKLRYTCMCNSDNGWRSESYLSVSVSHTQPKHRRMIKTTKLHLDWVTWVARVYVTVSRPGWRSRRVFTGWRRTVPAGLHRMTSGGPGGSSPGDGPGGYSRGDAGSRRVFRGPVYLSHCPGTTKTTQLNVLNSKLSDPNAMHWV
jgi:hypothetical protein